MLEQKSKLPFVLLGIIFAITLTGTGAFIYLYNQLQDVKNSNTSLNESLTQATNPPQYLFTSSPSAFNLPMPAVSPTPTATPRPTATPVPAPQYPKTAYLPLGGGGSTTSTDWVDVPNDAVWLDFANEYGTKARAYLEASVRIDSGSGTVSVRLLDTTHGIAVNGSEVSLDNTSMYQLVVSNPLTFWSGKNLYKVQIKSLNSSTVFLDSARIKVTY